MKKSFIVIFFLFIYFSFVGCAIKTELPKIQNYSIIYKKLPSTSNKKIDKVVKVLYPQSLKSIMSENILYLRDGYNFSNYLYSKWIDKPNFMLENIFLQTLLDANIFKNVTLSNSKLRADLILESQILTFHQSFESNKSFSNMELKFNLLNSRDRKLISSKKLNYKIEAKDADAKGGVEAFNIATFKLSKDLINWIDESL